MQHQSTPVMTATQKVLQEPPDCDIFSTNDSS
eukprot:COSAG01_NODE_24141_length_789_cov_0.662319_1_plen_31_part_10